MGGSGSGNRWRYGTKGTLNSSCRLDVRYLKRQGMLRSGYYSLSWSRNGEPSGNVNIRVVADVSMTVIYRWRRNSSEEWQSKEQAVSLAHSACAFGGSRQWFVCPYCSRRVAVVVVDGAHVACRHCLKLTYASCNEDRIDRSWSKRDKYKAKLGGDKGIHLKPKGMHHRTWQRLRHRYYQAEMQGWEWVEARMETFRGIL
jgi:hypothetical protein